jgi:stearoyl-CoA desaturase (delta-9 desaturase)
MQATFCINSLTHCFGSRRYTTKDDSRNNFWLALITFGEGWHNNHHHFPGSVNQGFYWWEIDITYYVLRLLAVLGIIWDLHKVPEEIRDLQQNSESNGLTRPS